MKQNPLMELFPVQFLQDVIILLDVLGPLRRTSRIIAPDSQNGRSKKIAFSLIDTDGTFGSRLNLAIRTALICQIFITRWDSLNEILTFVFSPVYKVDDSSFLDGSLLR